MSGVKQSDQLGDSMTTQELIEQLDQRYGNPNAKGLELVQEAIEHLRKYEAMFKATGVTNE